MKVGPYCGYTLDQIIDIKKKEEKNIGKYFWGYSGVFCRPLVVKNLVLNSNGNSVKILFVETKSDFLPVSFDRFEYFSEDNSVWENLSKDVLLVGNRNKDHFAITGKGLRKESFSLDLSQYCTLRGVFPNEEQRFDKYFKYRVDKACGIYSPDINVDKCEVNVKYVSELVSPYSVFIK